MVRPHFRGRGENSASSLADGTLPGSGSRHSVAHSSNDLSTHKSDFRPKSQPQGRPVDRAELLKWLVLLMLSFSATALVILHAREPPIDCELLQEAQVIECPDGQATALRAELASLRRTAKQAQVSANEAAQLTGANRELERKLTTVNAAAGEQRRLVESASKRAHNGEIQLAAARKAEQQAAAALSDLQGVLKRQQTQHTAALAQQLAQAKRHARTQASARVQCVEAEARRVLPDTCRPWLAAAFESLNKDSSAGCSLMVDAQPHAKIMVANVLGQGWWPRGELAEMGLVGLYALLGIGTVRFVMAMHKSDLVLRSREYQCF